MDSLVIVVCSPNANVTMFLGMDALVIARPVWANCMHFNIEKTTPYFGPSRHFECVVATQAASGEVGQECIFLHVYAPAEPRTT